MRSRSLSATPRGRHSGSPAPRSRSRSKVWLWVTLVILLLAVLAVGGMAFVGHVLLANRAPLGATFAGTSVAGDTKSQLHDLVNRTARRTRLTIIASDHTNSHGSPSTTSAAADKTTDKTADNNSHNASRSLVVTYQEIGATPNIDQTVNNIVASKGSNPLAKAWPWTHASVPLSVALPTDQALQTTLNTRLVDAQRQKIIPPSAYYDAQKHSFALNPGQSGQKVDITPVKRALENSQINPGTSARVATTYIPLPSAISPDAMNQAVQKANQHLACTYTVTAGSHSVTIPRDQLAQWVSIPNPPANHAPAPVFNTNALQQWISSTVPARLAVTAIPEVSSTDSKGTTILRHHGSDGLAITSVQTAAQQIAQAFQAGRSQTSAAQTSPIAHGTQHVNAPDITVQQGHWVLIDLSAQTVTAYNDSQLVDVYPMASGKAGHETPTGSDYTIGEKTTSQTMRGPGYVTPGVKWVSYFYQDYALHAAPWNLWNIALGRPSSHGCVNMVPADAKEIYNFAPSGTHVEVIGSPSASTARPTGSIADAEAWVKGTRSAQ